MFQAGDRFENVNTHQVGVVRSVTDTSVSVQLDGNMDVLDLDRQSFENYAKRLPHASYVADVVHGAMLRHARNAGAAVTALEIIRREAKQANDKTDDPGSQALIIALSFIEKFAGDVLSQILPA